MSDAKRPLSAEDLYDIQQISSAQISPDGRYVIYSQLWIERETEKKFSNLWLVDTASGSPRQFTYGKQVDANPKWSPDGRSIAFVSNRGDEKQSQIYIIPLNGGEARPLTDLTGSIGNFHWSPDGQRFVLTFRKKDAAVIEREQDEQKKKLGIVAHHITEVVYRFDGVGYLPDEKWHIWTVDAQTGEATQLTDGKFNEQSPVWSPDGRQILFVSNRNPDQDFGIDDEELYLIPSYGGDMKQIAAHDGTKRGGTFSPDGSMIAYLGGAHKPGKWYQNESLFVVPVDGSSEARNLTAAIDYDMGSSTLGDHGSPPPLSPPTWSADGKYVYATATRHGGNPLCRFDAATGEMETVIDDGNVVGFFSFDQAQYTLAYFYAHLIDPGQIYIRNMASGESRPVTAVNVDLFAEIDFGTIEEVHTSTPDGYPVHGWILKPSGFDPEQTYPSILEIHGGPQTQYGRTFMHEFYFLSSLGYVVYWSNPRGGQGYGEAHAAAISGDWNNLDYVDLMAWTDYVAELPYIDTERMGVTGGSYGGYMTTAIIGRTNRFKAAVPQRMVSNWLSFHGNADFNWGTKHLVGLEGEPWNNFEDYWRLSPMSTIGNCQTPTLIIHSEEDYRCSKEQSEQVYVALKMLGIDTELVLFPGESHGLSRGGRTDRRIARLHHIARWFEKYLK